MEARGILTHCFRLLKVVTDLPQLPLDAFLLPEDDPILLEFAEKLRKTKETPETVETKKSLWVHDHKLYYDERPHLKWEEPVRHENGHGPCGYDKEQEDTNPWYSSCTDREKHLTKSIDAAEPLDEDGPEECIDIGQSLLRSHPVKGKVTCVTPGQKGWLRRRRRFITGHEKMNLQAMMWGT